MNEPERIIVFKVMFLESIYSVQTFENEYRNLMVLLNDKIYIEDFGQCGGQGRCATCLVEIVSENPSLFKMERNENSTLQKKGGEGEARRLSCQIFINHALHGAVVKIIQDIY